MKIKVEHSDYSRIGVRLSSGDDEYIGCKLVIQGFRRYVTVSLPQWLLRPVVSWHDLSANVGKEGYAWLKPKPDGRYGYTEVFKRDFGFTWADRALHLYYGKQTMEWPGCKSKCFFLPWLESRHVRTTLLTLDGQFYADTTNRLWDAKSYEATKALEAAQPSETFQFTDYDGEVITATGRIEEMEWRHGTGWFKWLSLFRKPRIRRSLRLEFSAETGRRKGSWKGGVVGSSVEIAPGEVPRVAFARYCAEHDLTLRPEPVAPLAE